MAVKLQLQLQDADGFLRSVFKSDHVEPGATAELSDGLVLINMSAGGRNISANDLLTFLVEQKGNIAIGILSSAIWELIRGVAVLAIVNGKKIITKDDLDAALHPSKVSEDAGKKTDGTPPNG